MLQIPRFPNGFMTFDGVYVEVGGRRIHVGTINGITCRAGRRWVPGADELLVVKIAWQSGASTNTTKVLISRQHRAETDRFVATVKQEIGKS